MNKFNIGDKVRVIESRGFFDLGATGVVLDNSSNPDIELDVVTEHMDRNDFCISEDLLELIPEQPQKITVEVKEFTDPHLTGKMPAHEWFKYLKPEHQEAALELDYEDYHDDLTQYTSLADALLAREWGNTKALQEFWNDMHNALLDGTYHAESAESAERMATPEDMEGLDELVKSIFPEDDSERQKYPLAQTDLFFPDADAAFSNFCLINQQKHSPGTTNVTWAEEKSVGDGSQLRRHLLEFSKAVKDGDYAKADIEIRAVNFRGRELTQRWIKKMPPFDNL